MRKATPPKGLEAPTLRVLAQLSESLKSRDEKAPPRRAVQKGDAELPWEPTNLTQAANDPAQPSSERVNR